jgi:hypothetical protein
VKHLLKDKLDVDRYFPGKAGAAGAWLAGAAGAGAIGAGIEGAAFEGIDGAGMPFTGAVAAGLSMMLLLGRLKVEYPSVSEVSMKTTTRTRVALLRKSAGPVEPKRAWLPAPPKTAPMSAPLPDCRSTAMMRRTETMM